MRCRFRSCRLREDRNGRRSDVGEDVRLRMLEAADGATTSPSLPDQANTNGDPPCSQDQHEPGHDQQEDAVACVGLPCSPEERESRERQEQDGSEGSLPHGGLLWVPLGVPFRMPVHFRSLRLRDSNTSGHPAAESEASRLRNSVATQTSVLFEESSNGVDVGEELPDVVSVLVERQVPCRTQREPVARVRPAQPGVIGPAVLV